MKRTLLIVLLFGTVTSAGAQTPTRTMAVTIDDLPYVKFREGPYLERARAATSKDSKHAEEAQRARRRFCKRADVNALASTLSTLFSTPNDAHR